MLLWQTFPPSLRLIIMWHLQLFITSILTLLSVQLFAQQKDSIVSIHSIDYNADTVQESYTNTITYQNGKEVSNVSIHYWGTDNWRDSTTIVTTYTADGKPLLQTKKYVAPDECPQEITGISLPVISAFSFVLEDSLPEIAFIPPVLCKIHYYDTLVFSDTMEVKNAVYEDHNSQLRTTDIVVYYPDHQIKTEMNYSDGKLDMVSYYQYVYDRQGRPVKIFKRIYDHNIFTSTETHQAWYNGKPFETYRKSLSSNDSLHFSSFERQYDNHFNQIAYVWFQNGVFFGSGTNRFSDDGHMLEANTYNADSSLQNHHEYRWKFSRNTTEHWMSQNYQNNTDLNGFSYARYDTIRTPTTVEIRYSGKRIVKPKDRFKSYRAKACTLSQVNIYDKQKRLLEVRNFDYETGKISSITRYTYSYETIDF